MSSGPDFILSNHGSLYLLRPVSDWGRIWADRNIEPSAQRLGDAIAIEPRYVADVVYGARVDGLEVA